MIRASALVVAFGAAAALAACGASEPAPVPPPTPAAAPPASAGVAQAAPPSPAPPQPDLRAQCLEGQDAPECAALLEEGCKANAPRFCNALAVHALHKCPIGRDRSSWTADCDRALELFTRSCKSGESKDCVWVNALTTSHGQALQLHAEKTCSEQSLSVCKAACDGGDINVCTELGEMYMEGKHVKTDTKKGSEILRAACAKGSIRACSVHGAFAQAFDPTSAGASLTVACEANDPAFTLASCIFLMRLLAAGTYAPPLVERVALLRRLCARESAGTLQSVGACGRLKDLAESP